MTPPLVPIWQRPPAWNRTLPRDWQRPEAITGAVRMRPSRIRRAVRFVGGVLLALVLFYEINLLLSPGLWATVLGK